MVDKLHKYFERKSTEWCLTGFLDACEVEPFERKIDQYLRCLTTIAEGEEGRRKERAEKLLLDYREDPDQKDRKKSRKWNEERLRKQVHLHQPTLGTTINNKTNNGTINGTLIRGESSTQRIHRKRGRINYAESLSEADSSCSEYQEKPKKIKKAIKTKVTSRSSSSAQPLSSPEQTPDLVTDGDEVEQAQMTEVDFNKFTEVFQQLKDNKKWILKSGKVVEDELYKFGMRCHYEHLCHSFVVDPDDRSFIEEKVFTESELQEIRTYKQKPLPDMPQDLLEHLGNYQLNTISDLRTQVFKPEAWKLSYNRQNDFDRDWIRNTVDNLIREYEVGSLKRDHLEVWLLSHIWLFIDRVFEDIEGVEVIRGESCSFASSARKNRNRNVASVSSMPRKAMGRRGDLIIRCMSREYGCGEAGNLYSGNNGTKILCERGLKTPKMMKDQFDNLCIHMGSKEKEVRKLETIGFIHAGLSVLLLRLDSPAGYIGRITRSKMLTIPSTISEFGKGVLPVIMLAWKAKKVVSNVIEMMNQNDDDDPLQALQKSCEDTSFLSPPRHEIRRPTSFDTPSSKDKKGTPNNKNTPKRKG